MSASQAWSMSALERLGFDVAAARLLESSVGVGRLLRVLVESYPLSVPTESLVGLIRVGNGETVRTYACLLRAALNDIGLKAKIVSHQGGYRFDGSRDEVFRAVIGAVQ